MKQKRVFVRFFYMKDGPQITRTVLVSGFGANSKEDFKKDIGLHLALTILDWFDVPDSWVESTHHPLAERLVNHTFEALLGLNHGGQVSNLLATIFEAGFQCGRASK